MYKVSERLEHSLEVEGLRQRIRLLIEDGDRLAQILSDGEGKEDGICCVDYFNARDAVYQHAELIEKL